MSTGPAATTTTVADATAVAPATPQGPKIYAGNLSYSVNDTSLKAFFAPIAEDIVEVTVIQRGHRSLGYGFIDVRTLEAAQKAVDLLNGHELEGRPVTVEVAKPKEEKAKDKPASKPKKRTGKKVKAAASADAAPATNGADGDKAPEEPSTDAPAKPKKKRNPRPKSKKIKAAAEPGATTDTPAAEEPKEPKEKKVKKPKAPKPPKVPRAADEVPPGEPSKTTLFVANLGFKVDDAGLEKLFTDAGIQVVSANVVRRRWGNPRLSKGFGFVDVGSEENQKKALEALKGKTIDEREIAVKIAIDPPKKDENGPAAAAAATPVA